MNETPRQQSQEQQQQAQPHLNETPCCQIVNWPDIVGPLFKALNTEQFHQTLIESINRFVPIDSAIVMLFRPDEKPTLLYDGLHPCETVSFYEGYLAGAYLLGSLYRRYRDIRSGFYRQGSLEEDSSFNSEFGLGYYNESGLCDEGNFLIKITDEVSVVVSFGRQQLQNPFTGTELQQLHVAEPVFRAAIEKHWQGADIASPDTVTAQQMHKQLQAAMHDFGSSLLTEREQEVLQLMFEGKASKSAAKALNISPDTERGHRKNIYAKLEVASQAELFSLLFTVISEVESVAGEDPLIGYREQTTPPI